MEHRPLGRSGLTTAPWAFGGNVFGWTVDQETSFGLLDAFVGEGFNLIDTADGYSDWVPGHKGGESEAVIGAWLAARPGVRQKVLIATKVGRMKPHTGLSAKSIEAAVEGSLQRLGVEVIDLYQSHRDDLKVPLDETLEAHDKLVRAGKVRAIGASNYEAARLEASLQVSRDKGLARYETLQPLYNLMERGIEANLVPLCLTEEIGILPYYSLAAGFLTGKYRSEADLKGGERDGSVQGYLNPKGFAVLAALDALAEAHAATPAQVALAWVMARPGVSAAIASATSLKQLNDLAGAARLKLTADDVATLETASA